MPVSVAKSFIVAAGVSVLALPAAAQTVASDFDKAPWWVKTPVITQVGYVRTEVPANRAQFSASFLAVGKTADQAQAKAVEQTRALTEALRRLGGDKVQVNTSFSMRALYEQYRDRDGNRIENERGDKIESYQVTLTVTVKVRDTSVLERAYALVLAASPTSSQQVYFTLEPENETKTWLYSEALKDAARRANLATAATGARLGPVKVIDPTGRACQTDVLARGQPTDGEDQDAYEVVVSGARGRVPAPAPMAARMADAGSPVEQLEAKAAQNAFIQEPPLHVLTAQACVVYGLN
ncbi:MAG: SIMPL domain-containing protein [Asticcacaulis sp.]